MTTRGIYAVTGAFGFSGRHIAQRLLTRGCAVRTLTNAAGRPDPFGGAVDVRPLRFDAQQYLAESLRGVDVLYNTYWVRFNHRRFNFQQAVRNSQTLFQAAREAGVRRVVHLSVSNATANSPLEYYRGKAEVEQALLASGLSCAILRPTVIFGEGDILINNLAWFLRRFPFFLVFGRGHYRLRPVYVGDLADLAIEKGAGHENEIIDAAGPETFSFIDLVECIGVAIGKPRPVCCVPPWLGRIATGALGLCLRDVLLTRGEIEMLMRELVYVDGPPAGSTRLTDWARENAAALGRSYASELARGRAERVSYP